MITWFRRLLFKRVFGVDLEVLRSIQIENAFMKEQIKRIWNSIEFLVQADSELAKLTGGEGWTQTVQQAVAHLDNRLDQHKAIISQHQKLLEEIEIFDLEDEDQKELN